MFNQGYSSDGFGGNGSWLWVLVIFALLFGWGGNGFGGLNSNGVAENYTLASDFATIQRQLSDGFSSQERKLDSVTNGIASLGYDQLGQMNGINTNIMQTGFGLQQAINADTVAGMQNATAIQNQLQSCCCENGRQMERGFADTNYNMATQNCNTIQAINDSTKQIIDYLANEKAQTLRDENQALRLAASQSAQNNYLISQLRPSPIPAYLTQNPYCNCSNTYGYYNGTTIS